MIELPLGRRVPSDFSHIEKYPLRMEAAATFTLERTLPVEDAWHTFYDQGREGACAGFGASWAMSITNRRRYDAFWLYRQGQDIDEWDDTPPEEGTSVRAVMDILRTKGHRRVRAGFSYPASLTEGIAANRWARTVDQMRATLNADVPIVGGFAWLTNFDRPQPIEVRDLGGRRRTEWWIGRGDLGSLRGGHCVVIRAGSDRRAAFGITNNWGAGNYPPLTWIPYEVFEKRLIPDYGEFTMFTDR